MRITIDLPDDLVRRVRQYAVREGLDLEKAYAILIERGLDTPEPHASKQG